MKRLLGAMENHQYTTQGDHWISQLFSSNAALRGSVVRRSRYWVEREVGRAHFENVVRERGFHLIEAGDQFIVVCNNKPIRLLF